MHLTLYYFYEFDFLPRVISAFAGRDKVCIIYVCCISVGSVNWSIKFVSAILLNITHAHKVGVFFQLFSVNCSLEIRGNSFIANSGKRAINYF